MRKLVYLEEASANLEEITAYIAESSGSMETARQFASALRAQCRKIAALPVLLGRPRDELRPGLRSLPFRSYLLFFRYDGNVLEVVHILHGHRDIEAYFDDATPDP